MNAWRPLVRLAWRDVRRRPLRTALVALLIALPVVVITAINIGLAAVTDHPNAAMQFGQADARVELYGAEAGDRFDEAHAVIERRLAAIATDAQGSDDDLRIVGVLAGDVFVPAMRGAFEIVDGRAPAISEISEISVWSELRREFGVDLGDTVYADRERRPFIVVGVHERLNALGDVTIATPTRGGARSVYSSAPTPTSPRPPTPSRQAVEAPWARREAPSPSPSTTGAPECRWRRASACRWPRRRSCSCSRC